MAAIERKKAAAAALIYITFCLPMRADRAADMRAEIGYIATALTNGNPADAMTPFDKSYADYQKLSGYFQGLNGFQTDSEVDIVDEDDGENETKLTVDWTLTLVGLNSNSTERRRAQINVRLIRKDGKWKIVAFSPISLFNPLAHAAKQ